MWHERQPEQLVNIVIRTAHVMVSVLRGTNVRTAFLTFLIEQQSHFCFISLNSVFKRLVEWKYTSWLYLSSLLGYVTQKHCYGMD